MNTEIMAVSFLKLAIDKALIWFRISTMVIANLRYESYVVTPLILLAICNLNRFPDTRLAGRTLRLHRYPTCLYQFFRNMGATYSYTHSNVTSYSSCTSGIYGVYCRCCTIWRSRWILGKLYWHQPWLYYSLLAGKAFWYPVGR